MLRSITFPMHTASENKYRRQHAMISARKTKKQRDDVRLILSQLPRTRVQVDGQSNRFAVTFTRIAVGELDYVNLVGAFKAIEDEVAAWIGLDDRDPRFVPEWLQQPCKKTYYGVRIEVRDDEPGEDRIVVLAPNPPVTGPPARSTGKGRPRQGNPPDPNKPRAPRKRRQTGSRPPDPKQPPLFTVKAAAMLPWKQSDDELTLTDLPAFENVTPPPEHASARDPQGKRHKLTRRGLFRVNGLGSAWLYAPAGEAFDPDEWGMEKIGGT